MEHLLWVTSDTDEIMVDVSEPDIERGMPSMQRTFANIENHETEENGGIVLLRCKMN